MTMTNSTYPVVAVAVVGVGVVVAVDAIVYDVARAFGNKTMDNTVRLVMLIMLILFQSFYYDIGGAAV
jgi:hypothetical protein